MYNETINCLSSIALLIIFGSILYCWFCSNVKMGIPDEIILGKIIDPEEYATYREVPIVATTVSNVVRPINNEPKKKSKTQPKRNAARPATQQVQSQKVQRNHNGYTDLQQDCFDALKSLGIKAVRERQFIISNTFNKHDVKTVQDFLQVALHRGV